VEFGGANHAEPTVDLAERSFKELSGSSPRARLIQALSETISAAALAGDLAAARVASDALQRLLAEPEVVAAEVVDLAKERSRRR
jgi:hypothetical protein